MVTTERLTLNSPIATGLNPSVLNTSALWKRDEQLRRWQDSETNLESSEPKRSCKVNFQQPCVFLAACASGDQPEILSLLYDGVDINTANVDGMTALHQACIDGNFEIVKFLHRNGADINYQDNEGWSPLHAAASCGNLEITKYLVGAGADLTSCTSGRELALDLAEGKEVADFLRTEMKHRGIDDTQCREAEHRIMLANIKQLIAQGDLAALNFAHPKTGATVLHVAAANGYDDVVKLVLEAGVDPNCKDFDGWTPLHAAAHWDNVESAKTLMEFGGDCDTVNNAGHQVWDVCEEAMFATLINFKAELKNRAAANSFAGQKTSHQDKKMSETQKSQSFNSHDSEYLQSTSDSAEHDADRDRYARDVATPARELNCVENTSKRGSLRKNERIGRLQESLRTLSERFKSNANEVNAALSQSALGDVTPSTSSENAYNREEQQVKRDTGLVQNNKSDIPLVGDFVASRRTRFETAAKEATNSPIRRLGGVVKSESEESQPTSGNTSWGSCVGSLRFDSSRFDKRVNISRFDIGQNNQQANETTNEEDQTKPDVADDTDKLPNLPMQKLMDSNDPGDNPAKVRKKPASVIAGVTAVTVSSPLPLTVTANVSVSSNSSSSPPESAARVLNSMRNSRICTPSKDEQAEAERKKRSAKARRERRSTQGVSQEDLAQALANNQSELTRKTDRWDELSTTADADQMISKSPTDRVGSGSTITKPAVLNKDEELSSVMSNDLIDTSHASSRRRPKPIQRRATGQILWYEPEKKSNTDSNPSSPHEWNVKQMTRLNSDEDTVENNNLKDQNRTVAVQTADAGFLEKFSLCQLKTKCQELTRENDKLSANLKFLLREIYDKDEIISKLKSAATRVDQTDRRRVDALRADNIRLKEENAALIRVISKMSKQS